MLSNHFQNGIETAKLVWSRLPNADDGDADEVGVSKKIDGSSVESLDYEVVENHAYREEQAQRGKLHVGYYVVVKWFFALLIGIGTGLAAIFINISVENFAGWKYSLTFSIIQKSYIAGFVVYMLINLVLVYSSTYIITQFAPAAAGSGIPEIKGYLNGVDTHGILLFRTLIGKIFGSIGSVGGGLALGKEGPLVHIGACIASLLGQVTCGCAAGVAAAFRAPVGGVLFALEEVTSWWRSQLMWRVFFTSAIVAVVVRTAMGWCKSGKCGHFGSGGFIIWDVSGLESELFFSSHIIASVCAFLSFLTNDLFSGQEDYSFEELLPMAVIGVIGGLLGALFNQLTIYITYWRRNYLHKKGNRVKIIEVCLISLVTSIISFGLPLFRSCSPCPESDPDSGIECPRPPGTYGNYVNMNFNFSLRRVGELAGVKLCGFWTLRWLETTGDLGGQDDHELPMKGDKRTEAPKVTWGLGAKLEKVSTRNTRRLMLTGDQGGKRFIGNCLIKQGCHVFKWRIMRSLPRVCLFKLDKVVKIGILRGIAFYCGKDKEYNDLATIFFNTQDDAIRNLFSAKTIHEYSAQSLLTFLVMFYTLAVVTFGTAVPAGQFVPGIMIGSTYGRLVGMFVVSFYKKLNIEEGTYALLGAASFLGGSMRMTVSLCVIMVEITNNLTLLPLIMLVLLISKAVGDAFNEGLYEEQARLRGIPLLESRPKNEMRKMKAKEAFGNQKVVYFPRVVKVADVVSILKSNNHNGFPVIDSKSGETLVIGLMLRSHLLVLLQSKVDFQHSPLPSDSRGGSLPIRHNFSEFVKPASSKGLSIHDIHLGPDDLEMYIDLAPFVNRSPYIVPEDMSLTKVYNLFRQLGLRHIFVVPRASRVIGMITRKDLLIEDNEDPATVELQSTSVRDQQHNKRPVLRNADADLPLLNGLLLQDRSCR
ncbi:chloride channel D [Actinidia rufa]|uniref:Chloride channel protein n=1 Tax=Actinidia rufa TaxID=165716 RepID=A0A7J0HG54_9ERIC|nr:chloride channel D [Actinidia rufa]